jgi:DNA-binding XRE family transcriptional regulator
MKTPRAGILLGLPVAGWNRLPENMALVGVIRRRLKLGHSPNQLADRLRNGHGNREFSRQTLYGIESDKYLPGLDVLGFIASALPIFFVFFAFFCG